MGFGDGQDARPEEELIVKIPTGIHLRLSEPGLQAFLAAEAGPAETVEHGHVEQIEEMPRQLERVRLPRGTNSPDTMATRNCSWSASMICTQAEARSTSGWPSSGP